MRRREGRAAMDQQGRGNGGRRYGGRGQQGDHSRPVAAAGRAWQGDGNQGGGRLGGAWRRASPEAAGSPRAPPGRRGTVGPRATASASSPGGGVAAQEVAPWWPVPLEAELLPRLACDVVALLVMFYGLLSKLKRTIPRLVVLWICINNFLAQFDHEKVKVYQYDVDVTPAELPVGGATPEVSQLDLSAVKAELFKAYAAQFPAQVVAYDGHRSLFSPALHREGDFRVGVQGRVFHVVLKLVKPVPSQERAAGGCHGCEVTYFV